MTDGRNIKRRGKHDDSKITSLLAKYDSTGNLYCIICRTVIKTANLWRVHINSKHHKNKLEMTKQFTTNSLAPSTNLSQDGRVRINSSVKNEIVEKDISQIKGKSELNDLIPEKFFDDPIKDAKVRKMEYKDPQEEEWDKFQREIKEEYNTSNAIVAEDEDVTAVFRQIEEIDEQMLHWERYNNLEERGKVVLQNARHSQRERGNSTDTSNDEDALEGICNWRSKSLHIHV